MGDGHILANPLTYSLLKEKAEYNKQHPTDAERTMWRLLQSNGMNVRFRRQYVIGDFIVDFVALKKKLIIEVDGGYHLEETQKEKDAEREAKLRTLGFRIIRFSNEEVFKDMDKIKEVIKAELY